MMIATIREAIASINAHDTTKISDWRLVERRLERQERYYVASKAEQARAVDETLYSLTVYVDTIASGAGGSGGTSSGAGTGSLPNAASGSASSAGTNNPSASPALKKFRGEATITIQPTFSRAECMAKIRQAAFAASKSRNPWFELPEPSVPKTSVPVSGFEALSPAERIETVRHAFFSAANRFGGNARINSLELFITKETKRLLNSRGFDFVSAIWRGYSEFVVEADSSSGTVELFDDIEFSEPDASRLSEAIETRLAQVHDRAHAAPMPTLQGLPVILRGKEAEEVFGWFFHNSRTEMIYSKASAFEAGKSAQESNKGEAPVEPLDVFAEPVISGLPSSSAFDADGFPLERTAVIEDGILKTLIGSIRHADWLGVPRKGAFGLFSVSPGTMSLDEMHAAPYLEPVMFSDFRLDPVTGDFGAEVRLAYYFDGAKVVPVTGGSISGSLSALRAAMRRSKEVGLAAHSLCPKAVMLQGVIITGAC
jgi:predicted Zn-dependent protease